MKILHTSDWHLGHTLYGHKRYETFKKFLSWLIVTIKANKIDTLLICGDIFDTTTPSNLAQNLYYEFLGQVYKNTSCEHVVVVGGNHDSPSLLNAPRSVLGYLNSFIIGQANPSNIAEEVILLKNQDGNPKAIVCAVPFLRDSDLRTIDEYESIQDKDHKVINGTKSHYRAVVDEALRIRNSLGEDIPIIATGHLFATGCEKSDSERDLYIGTLGQIPSDIFPEEIDYLALGHIHSHRMVNGSHKLRYCGSPIPMSFGESKQQKIVISADISMGSLTIEQIPIPAFERLERVRGTQERIEAEISKLVSQNEPILVEVAHCGESIASALMDTVHSLTENSLVKVLRVTDENHYGNVMGDVLTDETLDEITPEDIFQKRLRDAATEGRVYSEAEKEALIRCHNEILLEIQTEDRQAQ